MTPEHRQAPGIEQQPVSPATSRARCARRPAGTGGAPGVSPPARRRGAVRIVRSSAAAGGEGDLLVLAEDVQLGGGEAQLGIGD